MKRNRSLNTTNGLIAKMESSYVTTCLGPAFVAIVRLQSSSVKSYTICLNRSLNTTNGLLAKMESSYVTTCFGLHLWPSPGYNLVVLRVIQYA